MTYFDIACNGKQKLDYFHAKQTAQRIRRQREDRVTFYRCHTCSWWHVGNSEVAA